MGFPSCDQADHRGDQGLVPTEGGGERGGEQGASQAAATAGDVTLTFALSTVVVERSKPSQGCSFFTTDLSEFGHADDQRQRGALTNAGNAQHQVKPAARSSWPRRLLGNERICAIRRAFSLAMSLPTMRRSRGSSICSSRVLRRAMSSSICSRRSEIQPDRPDPDQARSWLDSSSPHRPRSRSHRARRSWHGANALGQTP